MEPTARPRSEDLAGYLRPTWFIDSDSAEVAARAQQIAGGGSDVERAVRLFYEVRDSIRYDPYSITAQPSDYRASGVLERGSAYCIPKAVLLCAFARAVDIPARLGFADVRNHLASEKLLRRLGSDLFIFHGFTELWLEGQWLKATPAFNIQLCQRFGVRSLEFDGHQDALFHEYSSDGRRHMEYLAYRGTYADLPLDEIITAFGAQYGPAYLAESGREHDDLFDAPAQT